MNQTIKRYLISSGVTFLSIFLVTAGASLGSIDTTTAITGSVIVSLLGVALRAAVKGTVEAIVLALQKAQASQE